MSASSSHLANPAYVSVVYFESCEDIGSGAAAGYRFLCTARPDLQGDSYKRRLWPGRVYNLHTIRFEIDLSMRRTAILCGRIDIKAGLLTHVFTTPPLPSAVLTIRFFRGQRFRRVRADGCRRGLPASVLRQCRSRHGARNVRFTQQCDVHPLRRFSQGIDRSHMCYCENSFCYTYVIYAT